MRLHRGHAGKPLRASKADSPAEARKWPLRTFLSVVEVNLVAMSACILEVVLGAVRQKMPGTKQSRIS